MAQPHIQPLEAWFRGERVEVRSIERRNNSGGAWEWKDEFLIPDSEIFIDARRVNGKSRIARGERGVFYSRGEYGILKMARVESLELNGPWNNAQIVEEFRLRLLRDLNEAETVEFLREYFIANYL